KGGRMLRKAHMNRCRVPPLQPATLERFVEDGFVADADAGNRDAQALEIAIALELADLDEVLADQQRREAVAGTVVHLVRQDLEADAALDRIVEPDRDRAAAGVQLAGAERSDHLRTGIERHQLEREPLFAEIAFGIGDEERRVAAGTDNTDADGLGARHP